MNFKQIIQDYFTFSRNERKGITILLVIIFLLAIANKVIFYFETPATIDAGLLNAELGLTGNSLNKENQAERLFKFNPNTIDQFSLDSLSLPESIKRNMIRFRERGGKYYSAKDFKKMYGVTDSIYDKIEPFIDIPLETAIIRPSGIKTKNERFNFDPNTATDNDFLRLGIAEKQIKTIRNFQNKGGYFREVADFFKIYGLTESQKGQLANYITIDRNEKLIDKKRDEAKILIEINSTDSVELKNLPGIGNKLSKRIVKYRDLLGGFYAFEQLKEVYGLNEKTMEAINGMIKVDLSKIHKIDLNFSEAGELSMHPYIGKNMAGKIIKFRTRYGNISNSLILKDSLIMSNDEYERLKPYF